jgi:alpha-mannosidase
MTMRLDATGRRSPLRNLLRTTLAAALALGTLALAVRADDEAADEPATPSATQAQLYVVSTAHLDTQWLWTIQDTIEKFVPATLRGNFELFEKYPHYTFSFEGAFRYALAKEYYPDDYAKLKKYIAPGRWRVCGSAVDAGDVNVPAPESLIRNIHYGNRFFRREFGKTSTDIFLPDCFGFGYALPTVAAHCGLTGFSTQKLTWGSAKGIPFDIGLWKGVDGSSVIAAVNPGDYVSTIGLDLSTSEDWLKRCTELGEKCGAAVGYKYFGVGDQGGAPLPASVEWLERSIAGAGPVRVVSAGADQLYRDLSPEQRAKLPVYDGELLMTRHGVGCYTSQSIMKRWNRRNEQLADAAERAAVAADWLGGAAYPGEKIADAWVRLLWHHFHDDLTGTSIPEAYTFSWNDEIIVANQFAAVLSDSVGAVARALDTRADGVPLIVYNPLDIAREDVVEAMVRFPKDAPRAVRVFDAKGEEVPAQRGTANGPVAEVIFLAKVPPTGFAVYDVRPADAPADEKSPLKITQNSLENARYEVRIDEHGDIARITDKSASRELLDEPARLQLLEDSPKHWSEWEIDYDDITATPKSHVDGPAKVRIVEDGPARIALEITRRAGQSWFTQQIRLAAGDAGDRVEVVNEIDWHDTQTLVKAAFPLAVANSSAVYDLGLGTIERPNNSEKFYEVPAQQWVDVTSADKRYGVSILSDSRYGWDKPKDGMLRLTLLHSPLDIAKDQGRHVFTYALAGHRGDWREGDTVSAAARLNQPLRAFQTVPHEGPLGRSFSLASAEPANVSIMALKHAEDTDEIVVRVRETAGKPVEGAKLRFASNVASAREVDGTEQPRGEVEVSDGKLVFDLRPYQPRAFALKLAPPSNRLEPPKSRPVSLEYDLVVATRDGERRSPGFDGEGHCLPAELLPKTITSEGIEFHLAPPGGKSNAVTCRGQSIDLPEGDFNRVAILAAAVGDQEAEFKIDDTAHKISVQDFTGFVGQWKRLRRDSADPAGGFIKRDPIAWIGTHRHDHAGHNEPYVFCYLYRYTFDLPEGAKQLTLPNNERIRVMAVSVARQDNFATTPAGLLYDEIDTPRIEPGGGDFIKPVGVRMIAPRGGDIRYTLDGTPPTAESEMYTAPIRIAQSATLKARIFRGDRPEADMTTANFRFHALHQAENVPDAESGLIFSYYEGEWQKLPKFEELQPAAEGVVDTCGLAPALRDERYALRFEGLVKAPFDGIYTFYLASDDGSALTVAEEPIIVHDGVHGATERTATIALAAGLHEIRVDYFQRLGGKGLTLGYSGPGIEKQDIPAEALVHRP